VYWFATVFVAAGRGREMAQEYQSEIRESQIRELATKVREQRYGAYLKTIKLNKVRAF
jgi:hypothetical protein